MINILKNNYPVLGHHSKEYKHLDLSINGEVGKTKKETWYEYLTDLPKEEAAVVYYGGYHERRFFYTNEDLFGSGSNKRDIHLGVDLWVLKDTEIYAPFDATIESIRYNAEHLDYGHTIILKHTQEGKFFYSLYGHLSSWHIDKLKANDHVSKGEVFCKIGGQQENGGWPPHLHLQLILDLGNIQGDYPGVCSKDQQEFYRQNCPDPSPLIF